MGELLEQLRETDGTPGLTLWHREPLIHSLVAGDREKWCLVLGTVLVPSFQFQAREELAAYLEANRQAVMQRRQELRESTEESTLAYYLRRRLPAHRLPDGRAGGALTTRNGPADGAIPSARSRKGEPEQ